jgi:membrane dipeptidase
VSRRLWWATFALAALVVVALAFFALPVVVDAWFHRTTDGRPTTTSARAQALHARLFIADLHADTLLWPRDPLRRHSWGHVDLPRLVDGNVALQVFSVVNHVPLGAGDVDNRPGPDVLAPLAIAQRWPIAAWTSPFERVRHQVLRFDEAVKQAGGRLVAVRERNDLARLEALRIESRASGRPVPVGAVLALEGADFLADDPRRLAWLRDAGFRIVGLAHLLDTRLGGSAQGQRRGGITEAGARIMAEIRQLRLLPDLAHSSAAVIADVLARFPGPVLISHTGLASTCAGPRNLDDDTARAVARAGGLIGIGFWPAAVCGEAVDAIVAAIRHGIEVVGVDHIAIGSDFDGSVTAPFAVDGLARLTDALLDAGLEEEAIARVMGGNVLRLLRLALP